MGLCASTSVNPHTVDESHFERRRVMGQEPWARTHLAEHLLSGDLVALKEYYKDVLLEKKLDGMVRNERLVLEHLLQDGREHPFTQRMVCSFQTRTELYLVLPFMAGGSLAYRQKHGSKKHTRKQKLDEESVRYYVAELCLALEALHLEGFVHRDVRPKRVLIDADGHVELSFFGRCKRLNADEAYRSSTYFERRKSRSYTPPEVRMRRPYSFGVDMWSLGCTAYQLLHNMAPLPDSHGVTNSFRFSTKLSSPCVSFLAGLLEERPERRLGFGERPGEGWAAVRAHPWFQGLDWDALRRREVPPPWRPEPGEAYFSARFDAAAAYLEDEDAHKHSRITAEQHRLFEGWAYNTKVAGGRRSRRRSNAAEDAARRKSADELVAAAAARERREAQARRDKRRASRSDSTASATSTISVRAPSASAGGDGPAPSRGPSSGELAGGTLAPSSSQPEATGGGGLAAAGDSSDTLADAVKLVQVARVISGTHAGLAAAATDGGGGGDDDDNKVLDDDKESLNEFDLDSEYDGSDAETGVPPPPPPPLDDSKAVEASA